MGDREDRIRQRAYELWLAAGSPDGSPEQYWLMAEQELSSHDNPVEPSGPSERRTDSVPPRE
jgi:hypothetical protein